MNQRSTRPHLRAIVTLWWAALLLLAACRASPPTLAPPTLAPTLAPPTLAPTVPPIIPPPTLALPTVAPPTLAPPTVPPPTSAPAASAQGACYGPYTPVREGAVWRYRTDGPEGEPTSYTITYQDVSPEGFTASTAFEGLDVQTRWRCTAAGAQPDEFAQLNLLGEATGVARIDFRTVESRGHSWPLPAQWQVGYSWTYGHTIQGTLATAGGTVEITMVVDMTNRIAAVESVTVPAGTFPRTLRVDTQAVMSTSTTMGTSTLPAQTLETTMTTWYAEHVGMVREVYATPQGDTTVELLAAS